MKRVSRFETLLRTIKETDLFFNAVSTWMLELRGEGGSEIESQGWFSRSEVFSQETGAIGQRSAPRKGATRPKQKELSAGCTKSSDPISPFFSFDSITPWVCRPLQVSAR